MITKMAATVWIQAFIKKYRLYDWQHSWQQAFLIHFTLGGFGSPEKDRGFVLLLFVVTVYFFLDGLPRPLPLGCWCGDIQAWS